MLINLACRTWGRPASHQLRVRCASVCVIKLEMDWYWPSTHWHDPPSDCILTQQFVKTQMQLAKSTKGMTPYSGLVDCLKHIVGTRGITGLYAGVPTLMIGSFAKAGVRFYTYTSLKGLGSKIYNNPNDKKAKTKVTIFAGLMAGVCEAIAAVTPTETIKTKIIHDRSQLNPRFKGFWHTATTIVHEEGIRGLYRGLLATMLKQGCNQASRFLVYTSVMNAFERVSKSKAAHPISALAEDQGSKSRTSTLDVPASIATTTTPYQSGAASSSEKDFSVPIPSQPESGFAKPSESGSATSATAAAPSNKSSLTDSSSNTALRSLVAGAIAGFTSVYITMPFDIVKTRMQSLETQKSTWDCFKRIAQEEGIRAYWRGTVPRLTRVTFSASITFVCYEKIMQLLQKYT